jgi:Protein of unknown function (DUF4235)
MRLLYKPFAIVAGILGARAGRQVFSAIWSEFSDSPRPSASEPDVKLGKLAVSAALEGASLAASLALAQQLTLRLFRHLFGVWPGEDKDANPTDPA